MGNSSSSALQAPPPAATATTSTASSSQNDKNSNNSPPHHRQQQQSNLHHSQKQPHTNNTPPFKSLSSQLSTEDFSQALSYVNEFKCFHEYKDFVRCVLMEGHLVDPRCKDIYTKYGYCTMKYMEPLVDDCFTIRSNEKLLRKFGENRLPKGSLKRISKSNDSAASSYVFDIPPAGTENRKKWCFQIAPLQRIMSEWEVKSNELAGGEQNAYLEKYLKQIHALEPLPREQQIKTFPQSDDDEWPEMADRLQMENGYFTQPCMRASQEYAECLSTKAEKQDHEVLFHLSCSKELMHTKACFEKYHCSNQLLKCASNFNDPLEGYRMCRDAAVRPHLKYSLGALERCMTEVNRFLNEGTAV